VAIKEKTLGRDHPDVGISEVNLAIALQGLGRHREALIHIDRAIALVQAGLGSSHPDLAISFLNKGEVLLALGRFREAREAFQRARAIWEPEVGTESLLVTHALMGIGISYLDERDSGAALEPLELAFKIRKAQEPEPSRRADTSFALARALWESDRHRARDLAEQAKGDYARSSGKDKVTEVEAWLHAHGSS
jgi:tetratricopeptide (TPR) repeat protein